MRVMVLVKANEESERGVMPTTEDLTRMGAFNDELVKAGKLLIASVKTIIEVGSLAALAWEFGLLG